MEKGKNFSCNNLGQRRKSDLYETPYSLVLQLLEIEDFCGIRSILEPCSGNGAIVKVLIKEFPNLDITHYDLNTGTDFLKENREFDCIITNPPFSLATQFILKAKEVCTRKFAFLLPLSYLHGEDRYKRIYGDSKFPLKTVKVFTRYPLLGEPLREDGKYHTGMMVYAWYIWDKTWAYPPQLEWISNQKYILNKRDKP